MKYLVTLLAGVCMLAMFMPIASGLTCIRCSYKSIDCDMRMVICGVNDAPVDPVSPAAAARSISFVVPTVASEPLPNRSLSAAAAAPAMLKVMRSKQLYSQLDEAKKNYVCFSLPVLNTSNSMTTMEKGCKTDTNLDNCLIADEQNIKRGVCTICTENNCNGLPATISVSLGTLVFYLVPYWLVKSFFEQNDFSFN